MGSHTVLQVMELAKENTNKKFHSKDSGIVVQYFYNIIDESGVHDYWEFTHDHTGEILFDILDDRWVEKEIPKAGEYWYFKDDEEYVRVKEHRNDLSISLVADIVDESAWKQLNNIKGNVDMYSVETIAGGLTQEVPGWVTIVEFQNDAEHIINERDTIFLNANRRPSEWESGDLYKDEHYPTVREVKYPGFVTKEKPAYPVCFVEDRKDR